MSKNKIIILIIITIVVLLGAGLGWLYTGNLSQAKADIFQKTSLPVAFVGTSAINGKGFFERYDLAKQLLSKDPSFDESQIKGQIMDQMVATAKLRQVAKKNNVKISQEEIDKEFQAFVDNYAEGDKEKFKQLVQQNYRLDEKGFKDNILEPDLLSSSVSRWYYGKEDMNQSMYDKYKQAKAKLDSGSAFADVVQEYSEDAGTKEFGGETGIVTVKDLLPEFQSALYDKKTDDTVTIVSRNGLHIMKVLSVEGEGDSKTMGLQQIFFGSDTFEKWFQEQNDKIKVTKLIKA